MNLWCFYAMFHGHDPENVMLGILDWEVSEEAAQAQAEMFPDRIYYVSDAVK